MADDEVGSCLSRPLPTMLIEPSIRPLPVTILAMIQFAKAGFLLSVALLPGMGAESGIASIQDFRDLLFLASHGKDPKGLLIVLFGIYAAVIGWGLWRLKRWARNSLVLSSGLMLLFWLAHHDFGTSILFMPGISGVEQQTVYVLLLLDFTIFTYLKFHDATARSFGPPAR